MIDNRKSAPQRTVIEILRMGEWGKVTYIHKLECGHKEIRRRAAATKKIACLDCVRAGLAESMLSSLARPAMVEPPIEVPWIDGIAEDIAQTEQEIGFIRAGLANVLAISPETIDVVMEDEDDGMRLSYVVVYLDPESARRLASPPNNIVDI